MKEIGMVEEKASESENCCCDVPASAGSSACKECGADGKPVREITVRSLVKEPKLASIEALGGFRFCETPSCEVVYYDNTQNTYLHKEDVRVRIGLKEAEEPIPVCYCFGWTRGKILEQIKQQGSSTAPQEITKKMRTGGCACEVNNPSGSCCLAGVTKLVKQLQSATKS